MKKAIHLILCCVCLLMNIRVAYGEVVKRDTLVEDFSAADIASIHNTISILQNTRIIQLMPFGLQRME